MKERKPKLWVESQSGKQATFAASNLKFVLVWEMG
jgi:hypothetical protein